MKISIKTINITNYDTSVMDDLQEIAYKTIETINKEDMGFTFNEDLTIIIDKSTKTPNKFDKSNNTVYLYMNRSLRDYMDYFDYNLIHTLGVPEYYTKDLLYNKLKKYSSQEPFSSIFNVQDHGGLGILGDMLYIPKDIVINTPANILHDIITNLIKFKLENS